MLIHLLVDIFELEDRFRIERGGGDLSWKLAPTFAWVQIKPCVHKRLFAVSTLQPNAGLGGGVAVLSNPQNCI